MIKVLKAGFYTTVQDMGRINYQEFGVPVSGVMDRYSAKIANALVGNNETAAVFELTMTGPTLVFDVTTIIAVTGANMSPRVNGISVSMNSLLQIKPGDILSFGKISDGFRSYVSVAGGLLTTEKLGSKSMYTGLTRHNRVNKGDEIHISATKVHDDVKNASIKLTTKHFDDPRIEVYPGPEFEKLTSNQSKELFTKEFTISKENSRMAYQLEQPLDNTMEPIITSLVMPGTVQLTPSGKLIILMRDCQTTGGYPRILQLSDDSIDRLSQKYMGHNINFRLCN